MLKIAYTEHEGGFWKSGILDMTKEDLMKYVESAEVFHFYGYLSSALNTRLCSEPVIRLGDLFVHSIMVYGMRWDAKNREWEDTLELLT